MSAEKRNPAIARRRFFRPNESYERGPRVNERIRISPIRLIDENEQMVGVVETRDALQRARKAGLDLVEVSATSKPPVCRIMDFGKYKYEQSKKDKANRARSKSFELKEVRLGRSLKIDPHDIKIRLDQAKRFLLEGHKVQIVQNFHGREMIHKQRGFERMKDIIETLSEVARVEVPPRMAGRRMTAIFAPDKAKVEQYKRQQAAGTPGEKDKQAEQPEQAEQRRDEPDLEAPSAEETGQQDADQSATGGNEQPQSSEMAERTA